MKNIVDIASALSLVSVLLLIVIEILWNESTPKMTFIALWVRGILFAFAIPLLLRSFSLAANRNKIAPKTWLLIYAVILFLYMIIAFNFGFHNITMDIPLAINNEFSKIDGYAEIIKNSSSAQTIDVNGIQLDLQKAFFEDVDENVKYEFHYLPHSKYVVDVISSDNMG
jgi:hypothetical protein